MDHNADSGSASHVLKADIGGLLDFFDGKPEWSVGHATGLVGMVGEDLNTACLQHYLKSKGGSASVFRRPDTGRPLPVNTGGKRGPWLDRWIRVECPDRSTTVFQTEVKSWSAHAYAGTVLPRSLSPEKLKDRKQKQWDSLWDSENGRLTHPLTKKVLVPMKPPDEVDSENVRPMLIFWAALESREEQDSHLFKVDVADDFKVDVADDVFQELWVFSVSGYLRSLWSPGKSNNINLEMPDAALRLRSLNRLFSGSEFLR